MMYVENKQSCCLDEIDWGDGRKFKCNSYWNDDTSFALDIGDGELADNKDGNHFIHCEYNFDNGMWHYVFEIWFENDSCNIYDIPPNKRNEYLTETEMEELKAIIHNLCIDDINGSNYTQSPIANNFKEKQKMKKECRSQVSLVGAYSITLEEGSPVLFILGEHLEIGILHQDLIHYLDGKCLDSLCVKKIPNDCPFNIFPLSRENVHGMWDTLEIIWDAIDGHSRDAAQELLYKGEDIACEGTNTRKYLVDIFEKNWEALKSADDIQYEAGKILYRYLIFPVAHGAAIYQIVGIAGNMAKIRRCHGLGNDCRCEQQGEESVIRLDEAVELLKRRDLWKDWKKKDNE